MSHLHFRSEERHFPLCILGLNVVQDVVKNNPEIKITQNKVSKCRSRFYPAVEKHVDNNELNHCIRRMPKLCRVQWEVPGSRSGRDCEIYSHEE